MSEPASQPPDELAALFSAARGNAVDTSRAEYGFETRLMTRLRERHQPHPASAWALVSWRMIPFFAVCVVGLSFWHAEVAAETNDEASLNALSNPVAADWSN